MFVNIISGNQASRRITGRRIKICLIVVHYDVQTEL